MNAKARRFAASAAGLASAAMVLAACSGTTRSVDSFCSVLDEHKTQYLEQMDAASGQGLAGIATAIGAIGDLKLMWKDLAEVAPADIQTDVEAVRDAWAKQEDDAGDWQKVLTTALLNSGSMSRVDAYIRENCDVASGAAPVTQATPTAASEASTEPADGGDIDLPDEGSWYPFGPVVLSGSPENGQYTEEEFDVYMPEIGERTFTPEDLVPGSEVISQSFALAGDDDAPIVVMLAAVRLPATGLNPETFQLVVVAADLDTGSVIHTTSFDETDEEPGSVTLAAHTGSTVAAIRAGYSPMNEDTFTISHAVDVTTGKEPWAMGNAWFFPIGGGTIVTDEDVSGVNNEGNPCELLRGIDITTGATRWSVDSRRIIDDGSACWVMSVDPDLVPASGYDADTAGEDAPFAVRVTTRYSSDYLEYFDADTGKHLDGYSPATLADPLTGMRLVESDSYDPGVTITDPATNKTVFSVSDDDAARLDLEVEAFYDGYLWSTTTDGSPVVDVRTGQTVAQSYDAHPVARVGDWTLYSDDTLSLDTHRGVGAG